MKSDKLEEAKRKANTLIEMDMGFLPKACFDMLQTLLQHEAEKELRREKETAERAMLKNLRELYG